MGDGCPSGATGIPSGEKGPERAPEDAAGPRRPGAGFRPSGARSGPFLALVCRLRRQHLEPAKASDAPKAGAFGRRVEAASDGG